MYTQCSKCETVFRLSAQALRAAGGQVRCGRCGEVFNALARLAEHAAAFPKGESSLQSETRADAILESIAPVAPAETPMPPPPAPPDTAPQLAQLQIVDLEASLEFTLPPGELDRIFIETTPSPLQLLAASVKAIPRPAADSEPAAQPPLLEPPARTGLEISEAAVQEMLGAIDPGAPDLAAPRRRMPPGVWAAAAAVLLALLAAQLVRGNREWLTMHAPSLGGTTPSAALASYQLRQWGVTGDPGAHGTLRVRASIMNTTAQLQPYPLLRVTLADRFGTRVGQREFEAAEYLGKGTARLLAPGERIDATLDILDPGKQAEGFEIDVCIRRADKKIICAAEPAASSAPAK